MEEFTTQDLIAELQQYHKTATPRRTTETGKPCGVTHDEWAESEGISDTMARKQLGKLVAKGVLEREKNLCPDGQRRYVYYKV